MSQASLPVEVGEVYSVREVARAASVPVRDVLGLVASAQVSTVGRRFLTESEAVRATRLLTGRSSEPVRQPALFQVPERTERFSPAPYAASSALHAAFVAGIVLLTAFGLRTAAAENPVRPSHMRLVFVAIPGPGGGGGGGGLRQPTPPARAELKGKSALRSPVRTEPKRAKTETPPKPVRPPEPRPVEKPPDVPGDRADITRTTSGGTRRSGAARSTRSARRLGKASGHAPESGTWCRWRIGHRQGKRNG